MPLTLTALVSLCTVLMPTVRIEERWLLALELLPIVATDHQARTPKAEPRSDWQSLQYQIDVKSNLHVVD